MKEKANMRAAAIMMGTAALFAFLFPGSGRWILLALAVYSIYEGWVKA